MAKARPTLELLPLEDRTVPSGVPATWDYRGSGGGGALFSPQFNPANPAEITVASDMSGLYRTTDSGAHWQLLSHTQIQAGHASRVLYTNDPNTRYALDYSGDAPHPEKSTDGGLTWQPTAADPTSGGAYYFFVNPADKNKLLVTDYTRLYVSADGGATWALRYTTSNSGAGLLVGGAFFDGANIYLGTNSGLLVSTNGGTSFAVSGVGGLPAGQGIVSFAGAKQGATTRFFAVTAPVSDTWAGIQGYEFPSGAGVYTLDYGAGNWTARSLGTGVNPFFAAAALANAGVAYVAGGSTAGTPTVYKTTNGGASWVSVFQTTNNANIQTGWSGQGGDRGWGYGELALGVGVSAADPNRVVVTDYGFAHATADGGATWKALYVDPADLNPAGSNTPTGKAYHGSGLDNTTSWGVAWADSKTLFASNSDVRGQISLDGGQTWGFGYTGHSRNSMYRVVPHTDGKLYGAAASVHDLYQSTYLTDSRIDGGNGAVLYSSNKGVTWQTLHDFGRVVDWVATDPTNPNRLFASVAHSTQGGVYVTNNLSAGAASTWTKLAAPPRTEGHAFNVVVLNDGTLVASYSGRRTSAGAFTASSGVFVSTNGGTSWADRSDVGMRYWTKDVVIDPHDPAQNTWYAGVFSGWGGPPNGLGGLYKTTNRGVTWTKMLGNLDRVASCTFNPADPNELFVTTETQGLWYSNNIRSANPTFAQVANYPFRQPERVVFNPYNANEIWVTSFGGGLRVGTTAAPGSLRFSSAAYSVSEWRGLATITVSRVGGASGSVSVQFSTAPGTATPKADYTPASGTLTWADGDTAPKTFVIPITRDSIREKPETVLLTLSAPGGGASLGTPAAAVLTILDDGRDVFGGAGLMAFDLVGIRDASWVDGVYVG